MHEECTIFLVSGMDKAKADGSNINAHVKVQTQTFSLKKNENRVDSF